jgi:FSR family fosmidomycin resistance protein-like MFS transporter
MAENVKKTDKINSKLQIGLAMGGHTITDLYASFVIGLIPILAVKFNLSLFLVSLLTSVSGISNSLTQPVFGYFSDRYNAKYFLVAGPLFSAILISLLAIIPNYYMVLVVIFLGNLSISAMHPATAAIGGQFGGRFKGFSNSLISFSGTLGYALGSLFIIAVIEKAGLIYSPLTMIPGIIMAIILFKYIKTPERISVIESNSHFFLRLKKIKKIKIVQLSMIFAAAFTRDILWIALLTFMPLYFTGIGIELLNIGVILTAFTLIGGLGGILAGFISDKIKYKTVLILAGLLAAAPFTYFIFRTDGIMPVVLFIISGFFLISTLPVCIRVSQDIFPSNMSLASSLVMGLSVGTSSIVMIFLGKLADNIGIVKTMNYIIILIFAVSILLAFYPLVMKKAAKNN